MPETVVTPFSSVTGHDLERLGCREIRALRDVGICRWVLARETATARLLEIEGYDKSLTNVSLLRTYRNRCLAASGGTGRSMRLPERVEESDRGVYFFRPYLPGEPLHQMLLRPGRLNPAAVNRLTGALGIVLRDVLGPRSESLPDLLPALYLTDNEGVVVDALAAGPWTTFSDVRLLLDGYCDDNAGSGAAARQFAMRLFVRLTLGTVCIDSTTVAAAVAAGSVTQSEARVLRRIAERPGDLFWPDTYLRSRAASRRRLFLRLAALAAVIALLFGGRWWHDRNTGGEWRGDTAAGLPEVRRQFVNVHAAPSPVVRQATDPGQAGQLSAAIAAEARHIDRCIRDGRYVRAAELLQQLQNTSLRDADRLLLREHQQALATAMAAEYNARVETAAMLTDAGQFDEALAVTSLILEHYPKGPYRRDGQALAGDIKAARVRQWEQAHREATEQRRRRDADREQVRKVMKAPAAAFNTVLDNAKMIVETDTARELLLCLERFDHAERRLRHAAVDSFRETPNQPALLARVKEALPIVVTGDPRKLTPNGLEQREINGARALPGMNSPRPSAINCIASSPAARRRNGYTTGSICSVSDKT